MLDDCFIYIILLPLELNLTIQFLPFDNAAFVYYKDKLVNVYRKNQLIMNLHTEKHKKYTHTFTVWQNSDVNYIIAGGKYSCHCAINAKQRDYKKVYPDRSANHSV
jgi:hypothetical protein